MNAAWSGLLLVNASLSHDNLTINADTMMMMVRQPDFTFTLYKWKLVIASILGNHINKLKKKTVQHVLENDVK